MRNFDENKSTSDPTTVFDSVCCETFGSAKGTVFENSSHWVSQNFSLSCSRKWRGLAHKPFPDNFICDIMFA